MKKSIGIFLSLFFAPMLTAQSSYLVVGGGFLPHSASVPLAQSQYSYDGTTGWSKSDFRPGHSLHIGFGRSLPLGDHWALGGEWQFAHFEYLEESEHFFYFQNMPEELAWQTFVESKKQYSSWQLGLSLQRTFNLGKHEVAAFAGGYLRFKLKGWEKFESRMTNFLEISPMLVWDSLCECNKEVFFISDHFDPPLERTGKGENESKQYPSTNYGLHGGISFPLFASSEGSMKGRVMVSQDFLPHFKYYYPKIKDFYQTNITLGLAFIPTSLRPPASQKPDKRPLPSGIYAGLSLNNLLFLSMDGSWHSNHLVGLDFSARYLLLFFDKLTVVYIGSNCRLGNSRFFLKAGTEYLWRPASEGYDEAFFVAHVGGKYLLPLSNRIGLRFDVGYNFKRDTREGYPGTPRLGFGLVFMPVGRNNGAQ